MEVRTATATDVPAMVDVMLTEPSEEMLALVGSPDRARRFQAAMLGRALRTDGNDVLVAVDGDAVVGFAMVSDGSDIPPALDLVRMAVRSLGVAGAARSGWRSRSRAKVHLAPPDGGLHLVELQVHPHRRGGGIGGLLLAAVESLAREQRAPHLSLTTGTTNPARRLYERHGYELVAETYDASYERVTGVPGRVLMVKQLG